MFVSYFNVLLLRMPCEMENTLIQIRGTPLPDYCLATPRYAAHFHNATVVGEHLVYNRIIIVING